VQLLYHSTAADGTTLFIAALF